MTAPLEPVTKLNNLIAPVVSNDLSGGLAAGATATEPILTPNGVAPLLDTIDSCLAQLAFAVPRVALFSRDDDNAGTKILEVLEKPFDELGTAIADLLLANPNIETDSVGNALTDVGRELGQSIVNPFLSVVQSQTAAFESSVDQIRKVLFTGTDDHNGYVTAYFDRARTALKSMFLGDDTDGNFAAVYIFAFEHGIQAIDTEIFFLNRMKKLTGELIEESSKLPSIIDYRLPNYGIVEKLCEAEVLLKRNAEKLRFNSQFDRPTFSKATDLVCSAKDLIFEGKFDPDLLKTHSKNFLGVSQYKDKDLLNLKLLPNVEFKLKLQQLKTCGELFRSQERNVTELYMNIRNAADNIRSIADMQLGDMLAILVDVLRRQLGSIRRELQVFGAGFDTTTAMQRRAQGISAPGSSPTQIRNQTNSQFKTFDPYKLPNEGIRVDVTTYLSSQVSAYLVLANLCVLMQRTPTLYRTIDRILSFESGTMRLILDLVNRFDVTICGNPQSGQMVELALQNYLRAADMRLRQDVLPDSTQLAQAARQLKEACDRRLKFLHCMKTQLFFGLDKMAAILSTITNGLALLSNIKSLAANYRDVEKELRSLNFKNLLGIEAEEYSALDILLKSVQCLLLNCDNPLLQSVGRDMVQVFGPKFNRKKSRIFNMSSLDDIPTIAAKARSNRRIQQIQRVLGAVQGILNLNTNQLCNSIDADKEREANVHRSNASRAVFDNVPVTSVRPTDVPGGYTGPTKAVRDLGDALVVQSVLFPAEQQPVIPLTNPDTSFTSQQ